MGMLIVLVTMATSKSSPNWVAYITKIDCFTVLETRSSRSRLLAFLGL